MQWSLTQSLVATTVVGIATASLVYATPLWATILFTAAILLALYAVVAAFLASDRRRHFWIGFAVFIWAYLLLHYSPLFELTRPSHSERMQYNVPNLITTRLLEVVYFNALPLVHPEPQLDATGAPIPDSTTYPTSDEYLRVGHALFSLLFGFIGGLAALYAASSTRIEK